MLSQLKTQFRVWKALTIRHMQGQAKSKYGYVWLFLEPLIYILGFRLMRRAFGGAGLTAGMTPLMFYLTGILPLYACFDGIGSYRMLSRPARLTAMSRITQADVAIAAGISSFATYFFLFWTAAVLVSIYEGAWPPQNVITINLALIGSWIIGLAAGFALTGIYRFFPPIASVLRYALLALRMLSGFFFCITQVPEQYWPYLTWNPLLHVTELIRDAWFESYVSPIASPAYVAECALALLLLGLAVQRYMRQVPYA